MDYAKDVFITEVPREGTAVDTGFVFSDSGCRVIASTYERIGDGPYSRRGFEARLDSVTSGCGKVIIEGAKNTVWGGI